MLESRPLGRLRFQLLGPVALFAGHSGGPVRVSAQKGLALLAYLAMNAGRPVGRAVLADLLWGDRVEAQARQSLRQAILTLRRDLGPTCSSLLSVDDQSLSLAVEADDVDALQFVTGASSPDPTVRQRCLDIPWAPFLDGFSIGVEPFDEWVVAERHRLEAIATRVFSDLAKQFDAAGDGERAILALERLIAIDPAEEERHRRLLTLEAHYRGPDAALARAKEFVAWLKRDVDAEPEPATIALVEEIRAAATRSPPARARGKSDVLIVGSAAEGGQVLAKTEPPARRAGWRLAIVTLVALLLGGGTFWFVQSRTSFGPAGGSTIEPQHRPVEPRADTSWQSPRLPSQRADDTVAPGRGLVAIAVLPFTFHSDVGNEHSILAEMVTDDLTYLLSRASAFRVISRQTMMSYRGQTIDARTLGSELGIHYLLEGNVAIRGNVLRVTVGVIDTRTRLHVWSANFERTGEDRHELQTEIVYSLGRQLNYSVSALEGRRASSSPDVNELIFRGFAAIASSRRSGAEGLRPAEGYFQQALTRDPGALRATVGLGWFHVHMAVQMFAPNPKEHIARAEEILQPIIERHPSLGEAHAAMGLLHIARGEMEQAIAFFERSISLDPSNAPSYAQLGRALVRVGRPQEGLAHIHYAMKLSPRDPVIGYWMAFAGFAELELGHFDRAIEYVSRAHAQNPTQPRTLLTLIAANALAGKLMLARQQLALLQQQHPHLTNERLRKSYSLANRAGTRLQEGVLRALPEHSNGAPPTQH